MSRFIGCALVEFSFAGLVPGEDAEPGLLDDADYAGESVGKEEPAPGPFFPKPSRPSPPYGKRPT